MTSKYNNFLLLFYLAFLPGACVNTHDMTIYGVIQTKTGIPLADAKVTVDPQTAFSKVYEVRSNANGMYRIDEGQFDAFFINELLDPTHEITLTVEHPSYPPFRKEISFKNDHYRYDVTLE